MDDTRAPQWTIVLFFAPLVLAGCAHILEYVFQRTSQRWQKLSQNDNKRKSAMMALLKIVSHGICLGLTITVMMRVGASWGGEPTWLRDSALSTRFYIGAALTAVFFLFELAYKTVVEYDLWLHHIATVLVIAIASTGVFLSGDELQRALMASWAVCAGLTTYCYMVFSAALLAYHLQLDNFKAKKRLALFMLIFAAVVDRAIVLLPLAYTISVWGLLTVTSKALMLTLVCCFVPEHIVRARTMWGIYCLNRNRVKAMPATSVDLEASVTDDHKANKDAGVSAVGCSGASPAVGTV